MMTASRRRSNAASLGAIRAPLRQIALLFMVYDDGGGGAIAPPLSNAFGVTIVVR